MHRLHRLRLSKKDTDEIKDDIMDASESRKTQAGKETLIPFEFFSEGKRGFYVNMKFVVLQRKWLLWFSSYDIAIAVHVEIWDFSTENDMEHHMKVEDAREFKATMNQKDTTGITPEDTSRWTEYFRNRAYSKFRHNCPKQMLDTMFHVKTNDPTTKVP